MQFPRHTLLWAQVEPTTPLADVAHDAEHVLRVYRWALHLAPEAGADPDLAGAAALVHDLVAIPKDSAPPALAKAGYTEPEIAIIVDAVATSSWSAGRPPNSPEGAVLQDADRLDAIGFIGFARCMATAQAMAQRGAGSRFYDPADPFAEGRPLDDRAFAIDHLPRKLLRLAAGMSTPTAKAEAARRHEALLLVLGALGREISPP
jgi:uncharacterized protein